MDTNMTDEFADLTADERALVGDPAEWVTETVVPSRPKSTTAMFSLRVDRATFEALGELAQRRGLTFSEVAREALRQYVGSGGRPISISAQELIIEARTVRLVEPRTAGRRVGAQAGAARRRSGLATGG